MFAEEMTIRLSITWEFWGIVSIGVVVACLALMVGRSLLGRASPRPSPSRPAASPLVEDPFIVGSRTDKRSSIRRRGNTVPVFLRRSENEEPFPAWVVDRSAGGLGLVTEQQFEVGSVLSVRACHAPGSTPWVAVEVRSSRPDGVDWFLGCSFQRTPPWGLLLLFG